MGPKFISSICTQGHGDFNRALQLDKLGLGTKGLAHNGREGGRDAQTSQLLVPLERALLGHRDAQPRLGEPEIHACVGKMNGKAPLHGKIFPRDPAVDLAQLHIHGNAGSEGG